MFIASVDFRFCIWGETSNFSRHIPNICFLVVRCQRFLCIDLVDVRKFTSSPILIFLYVHTCALTPSIYIWFKNIFNLHFISLLLYKMYYKSCSLFFPLPKYTTEYIPPIVSLFFPLSKYTTDYHIYVILITWCPFMWEDGWSQCSRANIVSTYVLSKQLKECTMLDTHELIGRTLSHETACTRFDQI